MENSPRRCGTGLCLRWNTPGAFQLEFLPGAFRPELLPGAFRPELLPGAFWPAVLPGAFRLGLYDRDFLAGVFARGAGNTENRGMSHGRCEDAAGGFSLDPRDLQRSFEQPEAGVLETDLQGICKVFARFPSKCEVIIDA